MQHKVYCYKLFYCIMFCKSGIIIYRNKINKNYLKNTLFVIVLTLSMSVNTGFFQTGSSSVMSTEHHNKSSVNTNPRQDEAW